MLKRLEDIAGSTVKWAVAISDFLRDWLTRRGRATVPYSWAAFYFQIWFLGLIWWIVCPPSPGVAVGFLGLAAVLITIRGNQTKRLEQITWVLIAATLLFFEVKSVTQNHKETEDSRMLQTYSFERISAQIKRNLNDTAEILSTTQKVNGLSERTLQNITGDKSYAVVFPLLNTGGDDIPLLIENRGESILTGVTITLYETGIWIRGTQDSILKSVNDRVLVGTLHPEERLPLDRLLRFPLDYVNPKIEVGAAEPMATRIIYVAAQNFTTEEFLWLRKIGKNSSGTSSWEFKMKIYRQPKHGEKFKNPRKDLLLESTDWSSDFDLNHSFKQRK